MGRRSRCTYWFVPRVGGLAVYLSTLCLVPLLSFGFIPLALVFDIEINELTLLILWQHQCFRRYCRRFEMLCHLKAPVGIGTFWPVVLIIFNVWISSLGILGMDLLLSITP